MVKNNSVAFAKRNTKDCKGITKDFSTLFSLDTLTGSKTNFKSTLGEEIQTKLKDTSKVHYLTVYYLERGERESNMYMKFNLPEPNNMTVVNKVGTKKVNDVFKEEAKKVAEKDEFLVGITDKNLNEFDEQAMKDNEFISYTDEFKYNDIMQLKVSGLKEATRKLEALYNTSYELTDAKETISKKNGAVVSDGRTQAEDCYVLRNKSNTKTPFLMTEFTNEVATGELEIVNAVAKQVGKNDKFEYVVVYSNVFGGDSEAKYYEGTYIVEDEDGKETKKTAKNGKIVLEANETAKIQGIPAATKVAVQQQEMKKVYFVETIDTTENFESDEDKGLAVGTIEKETEHNTNEVIFAINTEADPEDFDDTPDTGDMMTVMFIIVCLLSMVGMTITVIKRKKA